MHIGSGNPCLTRLRRHGQRGVASLVVVMVLFFIVSLVAAYTNRNLIFEQRTSTNQYRATQAHEAAEAGLEWALAMLNGGRIDASCADSTTIADPSFRQRYLAVDSGTGQLTAKTTTGGAELSAACVFNGTDWDCNCPDNAAPSVTPPTVAGVFPAFKVRLVRDPVNPPPPGVIRLESIACTRYDTACLDFANPSGFEGRTRITTQIALQSALKSPPDAALTVRGDLNIGGTPITAYNPEGIAFWIGGTATGVLTAMSPPGTPIAFAGPGLVQNAPWLQGIAAAAPLLPSAGDRMFALVFGLAPATYQQQPALRLLTCPLAGCSAATVRSELALNPDRPLWLVGDVDIDTAGDIGSPTEPAMLVVTGNLTFSVSGVTVHGAVYSRATNWATAGTGAFRGAVIAETDQSGSGAWSYFYDPATLDIVRLRYGSFVFVPGSWKDYP
jgi:hypothetical protein